MNSNADDKLEAQLARLTAWDEEVPNLWREALKSTSDRPVSRLLNWRVPRWVLGTTCTAAAVLLIVALMQPSLSRAREEHRQPAASFLGGLDSSITLSDQANYTFSGEESTLRGPQTRIPDSSSDRKSDLIAGGGGRAAAGRFRGDAGDVPTSQPTDGTGGERQIVRKATIELETRDVRSAFLKAQQLVSEAGGEYVQDSALTGSDATQMQANLTLRVAATRLFAVLNDLRQLGKVQGERNDGTDVTSQVVDVEARIRNEQRVEKELLELLESRKDAALKDILDLRANLASVRSVIEQLTAQRQNLSRLVSLATVLVIIRTDNAPPPEPPPPGIGAYFAEAFSNMWTKGLRVLADTLATLLGTLVGGLPWWILLGVTVVVIRRVMRIRAA